MNCNLYCFQVATSLLRSLEESAFLVADVARDGEEYLEEATREIGRERKNDAAFLHVLFCILDGKGRCNYPDITPFPLFYVNLHNSQTGEIP